MKKLLLPVLYTDKLTSAKDFLNKEILKSNSDELEKAAIYAILSKNLDWSYENEWRLVETTSFSEENKYTNMQTPTAVYFGHHLDEEIKKILIEKSKELKIPKLYDVKESKIEYSLIITEI